MNSITNIEDLGQENGKRFWWAHELSDWLGYKNFNSFKNVVRRAMADADSIGVDSLSEFEPAKHVELSTYKLTRFAVMLCITQADNKKPNVRKARSVLVGKAETIFQQVERLNEREKLKGNEKLMVNTAVKNGLPSDLIALFKDKGYRGLYNMGVSELKRYKGANDIKGTLYDMMNPIELAANSFRAAMTSEKIRNENITSQTKILNAASSIGEQVRNMVIENTGQKPEDIPLEEEKINRIRTKVKKQSKNINQMKFED